MGPCKAPKETNTKDHNNNTNTTTNNYQENNNNNDTDNNDDDDNNHHNATTTTTTNNNNNNVTSAKVTSLLGRNTFGHGTPEIVVSEVTSDLTADLRTKILDFTGFDSNIIFMLSDGILMPIGNFPEMLSQQILVGIILVGRLGVPPSWSSTLHFSSGKKSKHLPSLFIGWSNNHFNNLHFKISLETNSIQTMQLNNHCFC